MPAKLPPEAPPAGFKHPIPGDLEVPPDRFARFLVGYGVAAGLGALALIFLPEPWGNKPLAFALAVSGAGMAVPGLITRRRWMHDPGARTLECELSTGLKTRTVVALNTDEIRLITSRGRRAGRRGKRHWEYQTVAVTRAGRIVPLSTHQPDVYRVTEQGRSFAGALRLPYEIGQFERVLQVHMDGDEVVFEHVEWKSPPRWPRVLALAILAALLAYGAALRWAGGTRGASRDPAPIRTDAG